MKTKTEESLRSRQSDWFKLNTVSKLTNWMFEILDWFPYWFYIILEPGPSFMNIFNYNYIALVVENVSIKIIRLTNKPILWIGWCLNSRLIIMLMKAVLRISNMTDTRRLRLFSSAAQFLS
jgi:hypothetical protein